MAGIAFVAFIDFGKRAGGAERNFLARHNQILQRACLRGTFHAEEGYRNGVEVRLVPVVLGHARDRIDRDRVLQLRLDVGDQIVRNLRGSKFQFGGILSADGA